MNSKNIGNSYERSFSYTLSEWLTGEKDSDCCWRDLSSGSRATKRSKEGKDTQYKADIICTDLRYIEFFNLLYIDTKTFKGENFYALITNENNIKSNRLFYEWRDTVEKCPKNMKPLMPVHVRDKRTPEFLILPYNLNFNKSSYIYYCVDYIGVQYKFYLVFQDQFFKLNNWEELIAINKG